MPKSNLLYIITKLELGGAQKQLLSLIGGLDKDKFRVFLLTAGKGLLLPDALRIDGLTVKKSGYLERPINPLKDLLALIEIYRFIKYNNIGIVHTHSSKAGILGRLAGRLAGARIIIHTVHGWSFNGYQPALMRAFYLWLERLAARFTDKLIVVSNYDKEKGLDNRIASRNKYALIRYGIDYSQFDIKGRDIKKELGIRQDEPVAGMIACFKPQKSPQDFIKLASLIREGLPNAKFLLIGDGELRMEIETLINKLNLKESVILTGWRMDIPEILSTLDVFVLTSLWEGLPISALEAMASAKPVVATDTGGIAEAVTNGKTGFLFPPRNVDRLAKELAVLLKDKELSARMGRQARESLGHNFAFANMLEESENLYGALSGQGGQDAD